MATHFIKRLIRRAVRRYLGGETPEFAALLEGSLAGLQLQSNAHAGTWNLGSADRWDFDQSEGLLVFTFPDKTVSTPAQVIGSFDSNAGTWMWAWANPSIDEALQRDALRVREYGEQHGIERLTTPTWEADDTDAWHMTALANRLCESNGAYRGPAGTTFVFMTFGAIKITPKA